MVIRMKVAVISHRDDLDLHVKCVLFCFKWVDDSDRFTMSGSVNYTCVAFY